MATMTVLLDRENSEWLRQQGLDPDVYVNEVLRKDQERKLAEAELRRMLSEAAAGGISPRTPEQIRQDARDRFKREGVDTKP